MKLKKEGVKKERWGNSCLYPKHGSLDTSYNSHSSPMSWGFYKRGEVTGPNHSEKGQSFYFLNNHRRMANVLGRKPILAK